MEPPLTPKSPTASSSAVTIPIPGKSILKKRSAPPPTLLSRIGFSRFLPPSNTTTSNASSGISASANEKDGGEKRKRGSKGREADLVLRRAHFILPNMSTTYPINNMNPPSTPQIKEEIRMIEGREHERRRRVVRMGSYSSFSSSSSISGRKRQGSMSTTHSATNQPRSKEEEEEDWWTIDKVESFYRECCAGLGEPVDPLMSAAFKNAHPTHPRTLVLSGIQQTETSASLLSDVFSIEWGLRRLEMRECDLGEATLKPLLHSLLLPNSLSYLSIASNRKLKVGSIRLIGAYIGASRSLSYLDISSIPLSDKKAVEYISSALKQGPPASGIGAGNGNDDSNSTPLDERRGLVTLKMDDCALRGAGLEALAKTVRTSTLQHLSLRHNRIPPNGGVALALMIRDYPDSVPLASISSSGASSPTRTGSPASAPLVGTPPLPPRPGTGAAAKGPPPAHPATGGQQVVAAGTTYTPYVPRSRRGAASNAAAGGQVVSSKSGGVTAISHAPNSVSNASKPNSGAGPGANYSSGSAPSEALLSKVRALDNLPRLGSLRTLDLRGNDLRNGISYLAQVLKRNRTLKTLNLAENKIDERGLALVGEGLKYNSALETLDLSRNACCGPSLEGVQSLRTSLSLSATLKRLFLTGCGLKAEGAIALAEFLPESGSLLYLGLTQNDLGYAGVMALSEALKKNGVIRCLDLDVPPGDEGFARMCRDILNSCIRNTEEAERSQHLQQHQGLLSSSLISGSGMSSGYGSTPASSAASVRSETSDSGTSTPAEPVSKRGTAKGVWAMVEESELAKGVKLGEDLQSDNDVLVRARACAAQLSTLLASPTSNAPSITSPLMSPRTPAMANNATSSGTSQADIVRDLTKKAKKILGELQNAMLSSTDMPPSSPASSTLSSEEREKEEKEEQEREERMSAMLEANDALTGVLARVPHGFGGQGGGAGGKGERPTLSLAGLGLRFNLPSSNAGMAVGGGPGRFGAGAAATGGMASPSQMGAASPVGTPNGTFTPGLGHHGSSSGAGAHEHKGNGSASAAAGEGDALVDEDDALLTPKIDKGKARAEPELEEHEKVLSPIAGLDPSERGGMDDTEDEEDRIEDPRLLVPPADLDVGEGDMESPTQDRSRSWVEEEGEVFRKGNVLLGENEMESDYAGEELRKELLEAMVERPPPREVIDEFSSDPLASPSSQQTMSPGVASDSDTVNGLSSPILPPSLSHVSPAASPVLEKPPPRPYVSRSRSSSNSIMSVLGTGTASPTTERARSPLGSPIVESRDPITSTPAMTSSPLVPSGTYAVRKGSVSNGGGPGKEGQ